MKFRVAEDATGILIFNLLQFHSESTMSRPLRVLYKPVGMNIPVDPLSAQGTAGPDEGIFIRTRL